MKINRAYKTKIEPTRNQVQYLEQCGEVARTVFNWVLGDYNDEYKAWHEVYQKVIEAGIQPAQEDDKKKAWDDFSVAAAQAGFDLPPYPQPAGRVARKKKLNALKYTEPRLKFLTRYPYVILQEAIDDFDEAMKNYRQKVKNGIVSQIIAERKDSVKHKRRIAKMMARGLVGQQLNPCYPNYKRRDDKCSFTLRESIVIEDRRIKLPKIGWVALAEHGYIPINPVRICYASISRDRDTWYISVTVEEEREPEELNPITLGVSVGVMDFAATSTGDVFENPRVLATYEKKKKKLQRELSRRTHKDEEGKVVRTRKNWLKTKAKLSKLEQKIERARAHHQHVASKGVTKTNPALIVLKQMDIKDMQKNSHVAKALSDAGMGELTRQIVYKGAWQGTDVRQTKSEVSGYCSNCGSYDTEINYAKKTIHCNACGQTLRATINTAINLTKVAA